MGGFMTMPAQTPDADPVAVRDADASHDGFGDRVRSAVFWRSGGQIVTQILSWVSTLMVIRILNPADYGLFAMAQAVIAFMTFLNGYGLVSALVQSETIDTHKLRQAFGLMLVMNGGLAAAQFLLADAAAAYYHQPVISDMLRVQCLIYLSTPFIALPEVLMGRSLDFRKPAYVNLVAGIVAASLAIAGALAGWGVWTLVWAPIAGFWTRAVGYFLVTRFFVWPSFDFRGAGPTVLFAFSLLGGQLFWLIQSQADVFIGGRVLEPHALGLYAEALFLTQIFVSKFIPPLNDVAFPIYARMQADRQRVGETLCKAIRLIMLVAAPLYLGLAVTAESVVYLLFGPKWMAMAPYVQLLALAMPFMTLQVMFPPLCNAMGRPGVGARIALIGAIIMPAAFLVGIGSGPLGLAQAWLFGYPVFALLTAWIAGRLVDLRFRLLAQAVAPGFVAAVVMAIALMGLDHVIGHMSPVLRLCTLVGAGGVLYVGTLMLIARDTVLEFVAIMRGRGQALDTALAQQGA